MHTRFAVLFGVLTTSAASVAQAVVKLPAIISDNMMLQQNIAAPLWGCADPGEKITVTLLDQKKETLADPNGHWRIALDPITTHDPFSITVTGSATPAPITIHNALAGEVWLAGGQSNMGVRVEEAMNAKSEMAAANYPLIRHFHVNGMPNPVPQDDVTGEWVVCTPKTVGKFTAVGYYFARDLFQTRHTPVGLLDSNWGGTAAQPWTRRAAQEKDPELAGDVKWWDDRATDENEAKYKKAYAEWKVAADKAKAAGTRVPPRPEDPIYSPQRPANLFNGKIQPLIPYAIKGVIWYQGESNVNRARHYQKLFPTLIQDWRSAWKQAGSPVDDFPFLFVQLANHGRRVPTQFDHDWARLREAQAMALAVPNTAMAVTIDVGEDDIHPLNKQTVGHRLALAARAAAYDEKLDYIGPTYQSFAVEGHTLRIHFTHAEGLVSKTPGPETRPALPPTAADAPNVDVKGFAIAGADHIFHPAHGKIDGQSVIVWSDEVPHPEAVRYGFAENPQVSLYNAVDLPAVPFRTDTWDPTTTTR